MVAILTTAGVALSRMGAKLGNGFSPTKLGNAAMDGVLATNSNMQIKNRDLIDGIKNQRFVD